MIKNILVMGAGKMGVACAYALGQLGYHVHLADVSGDMIDASLDKLENFINFPITVHTIPPQQNIMHFLAEDNFSAVVSCAPYSQNVEIADDCGQKGRPYLDLGGNPEVSAKIKELAIKFNVPMFTDLGVAPGLVNIVAERIWDTHGPSEYPLTTDVKLKCGGLTETRPDNTLGYFRTFNTVGLYNELTGPCEVIKDGVHQQSPALGDYELHFQNGKRLEAFNTKGGLASTLDVMLDRGVKNCSYQTLRYEGHLKYLQFLLLDCKMDKDDFCKAIEAACPETTKDALFIFAQVGENYREAVVEHDEHWTAMQKATSFPTAAVAALMADRKVEGPPNLSYDHIPLDDFVANLKQIGGLPVDFLF